MNAQTIAYQSIPFPHYAAQHIGLPPVAEWLARPQAAPGVYLPQAISRITPDAATALVLAQILYWHRPSASGSPRLRVKRDGHFWLVKQRAELAAECGNLSVYQVDRALRYLADQQLIVRFTGFSRVHFNENGSQQRATYIRIRWATLQQKLAAVGGLALLSGLIDAENKETALSENAETTLSENPVSAPSENAASALSIDIDCNKKLKPETSTKPTITPPPPSSAPAPATAQAQQPDDGEFLEIVTPEKAALEKSLPQAPVTLSRAVQRLLQTAGVHAASWKYAAGWTAPDLQELILASQDQHIRNAPAWIVAQLKQTEQPSDPAAASLQTPHPPTPRPPTDDSDALTEWLVAQGSNVFGSPSYRPRPRRINPMEAVEPRIEHWDRQRSGMEPAMCWAAVQNNLGVQVHRATYETYVEGCKLAHYRETPDGICHYTVVSPYPHLRSVLNRRLLYIAHALLMSISRRQHLTLSFISPQEWQAWCAAESGDLPLPWLLSQSAHEADHAEYQQAWDYCQQEIQQQRRLAAQAATRFNQ